MCRFLSLFRCRLKPGEIHFLKDYAEVMKPVAQALNILEGENQSNAYMGYLAPTISLLKKKLHKKNVTIPSLKPLFNALRAGLDKRFSYVFDDEKIITAIVHPKFKNTWTNDQNVLVAENMLLTEKKQANFY